MTGEATKSLYIITGEPSGDALAAPLIRRLKAGGDAITLMGVGGTRMAGEGFESLFPQGDIAVNGVAPVIRHLPTLLSRMRQTVDDVVRCKPDLLLTIDSPDFTLRVAKRARARLPGLRVVHWVCPSVWAWRPGRAVKMRPYVDEILCLLPFEPKELEALSGPRGTYVGHPLIEHLHDLRPASGEEARARADEAHPLVLILPGSRRSEVSRLLDVFGQAARRIACERPGVRFVLPAVEHLRPGIEAAVADWNLPVTVAAGEAAKLAAFRQARVAMAASGTVTLELALAAIPTIGCYKVSGWEAWLARRLIRAEYALLPNLILGRRAVPELLQDDCTPETVSAAVLGLLDNTSEQRQAQLADFAQLETIMESAGMEPSQAAADLVRQRLFAPET